MKKIKLSILIIILTIALIYTSNINSIPGNIILFEGEKLNINILAGMSIKSNNEYEAIQTSSKNDNGSLKKQVYNIELLNSIPVKTVTANIIPKTEVIPIGTTVGLKLYTDGVLVVGMSEIEDINNEFVKPYEDSNIKEGDRIVEVNDNVITCTADLIESVNKSNGGSVRIKYINSENIYNTDELKPAKVSGSQYKLGLWVRDAAAGVGTITFYEPSTKNFGALGHGIVDIDTGELIDIANGELTTANVISVVKGEKGNPGEIKGSLVNQNNIGDIAKNTRLGIYGKITDVAKLGIGNESKVPVALRDEIKEGKAKIICSLDNGKHKEYEIEIERIFKNNNEDNKSMIIKVTDEELLEKTGGIIQRNEWKSYYSER